MCCFGRCSQGTAPLHTQHIKENHDTPKEKRTPYVTNFSGSARPNSLTAALLSDAFIQPVILVSEILSLKLLRLS